MRPSVNTILTNSDFIELKEVNAISTGSCWNETRVVVISHPYRDETIELIALGYSTEAADL